MLVAQQRKLLQELQGFDSDNDIQQINNAVDKAKEYQEMNEYQLRIAKEMARLQEVQKSKSSQNPTDLNSVQVQDIVTKSHAAKASVQNKFKDKKVKVFFDKDDEKGYDSNMYGMSDDNMSCVTAQHRTGYGIDEPYNRNVNKPGTGMSNVTRMTKMTQKTAVTKVAAQPFIRKIEKKPSNNFDLNSKIGGMSIQTRKYNSVLRNVRQGGTSDLSGATTPMYGQGAKIGYANGFRQYGKNTIEPKQEKKIVLMDDEQTLPDIHQSKLDKQQSEANFGQRRASHVSRGSINTEVQGFNPRPKNQPKLRDLRESGMMSEKNRRGGLRFGKADPEIDYQKVSPPPEPVIVKKQLKTVEFQEVKSSEFAANGSQVIDQVKKGIEDQAQNWKEIDGPEVETSYNINKYSNFIQDLSSHQNAVIDVNYHTKQQKQKLMAEQKEITQKQLELQRQQIILQQQQLQLQLDRLEENQRKVKTEQEKINAFKKSKEGAMQSNANVVQINILDSIEKDEKSENRQSEQSKQKTEKNETYSQKSEIISPNKKMAEYIGDGNYTEIRKNDGEKDISQVTHGATRDISFMKADSRINKSIYDETHTPNNNEPSEEIPEIESSHYDGPYYIKDQFGQILTANPFHTTSGKFGGNTLRQSNMTTNVFNFQANISGKGVGAYAQPKHILVSPQPEGSNIFSIEANHMNKTFHHPMYVVPGEQYFLDHFPPEEKVPFNNGLPNNTFQQLFSPDRSQASPMKKSKTNVPIYEPGKQNNNPHFSAFDKKDSRSQPNQSKNRINQNSSSLTRIQEEGQISPQNAHKRHQSQMESEINSLPSISNKKIPNLKFAKANANNGFQNPLLTPVTFVSKDQQMKADYQLDSEVEEIFMPGAGSKILNYKDLKRLDGTQAQVQAAYMPHPQYLPPIGMPIVQPQYIIGPDGQLQQLISPYPYIVSSSQQNLAAAESGQKLYMYRKSQEDHMIPEHPSGEDRSSPDMIVRKSEVNKSIGSQDDRVNYNEDLEEEERDAYTSEYSQISRNLDLEMRQYVNEFQKFMTNNDRRSELMMRRIRLKHPIFHLLTINAFKYLFENGILFKVKPGQCIYKEYQPAKAHIYFVLYGQMDFRNSKVGKFGEIIGLGWTVGEEILYGEDDDKEILRLENCTSVGNSCLLQCSVDDLVCMSTQKHVTAGGGNLEQDYKILLSFLEKNYEVKSNWRKDKGLLERIKEVDMEDDMQEMHDMR